MHLGLDSSTQGLKAVIIDTQTGATTVAGAVNYGGDLPEYGCPNGVLENTDPLLRHAPPGMWLAALDLLFAQMQANGAPLDKIRSISGSGQQHGSVYLGSGFDKAIAELDPSKDLAGQLEPTLTRDTAPIWMDSSTSDECTEITEAVGPRLQTDTGSPATERFTGPQIRKFWKQNPTSYGATSHIHLVSSFMCSVLAGKTCPIDYGDGAGMNLLNLHDMQWDKAICTATAPDLESKLPSPVKSSTIAGPISPYFRKYGFREDVQIVVWSGDNPNSLIGVGAGIPGTAVISLGTSDVFFAAMDRMHTDPGGYGHVFGNPAGGFMSLICFKNGSLARERIKDEFGVDWDYFGSDAFNETPPGNQGNIMTPFYDPEITPVVLHPKILRQGQDSFVSGNASAAVNIRAVVESQALSMKLHSSWIGDSFSKIRITGGASRSPGLVQVIADVFQADVELISVPESAALGAAMRAANASESAPWNQLYATFCAPTQTVRPNPATAPIYERLIEDFSSLLQKAN